MLSVIRFLRIWACVGACWLLLGTFLVSESASSQEALIVTLGDSNTAGYGVGPRQAYPAQLEAILHHMGHAVRVINAGVAGDTFPGMLSRLKTSVPQGTHLVIIQGGYMIVSAVQAILLYLKARQIKVVLCGFFYPDWDAVGHALATSFHATFVDGSACYDPRYRGPDGLHMTAAGHQAVAARLASVVESVLFSGRAGACIRSTARSRGECPAAKRPKRSYVVSRSTEPSRATRR
jgi:acyl-CoA thioesterase I